MFLSTPARRMKEWSYFFILGLTLLFYFRITTFKSIKNNSVLDSLGHRVKEINTHEGCFRVISRRERELIVIFRTRMLDSLMMSLSGKPCSTRQREGRRHADNYSYYHNENSGYRQQWHQHCDGHKLFTYDILLLFFLVSIPLRTGIKGTVKLLATSQCSKKMSM